MTADAPDNMQASFPTSLGVAVTPRGKELESPRAPDTTDSTYVAPSWTPGAAALRPTHHAHYGATPVPAKSTESEYEYYSDDEEEDKKTQAAGRATFPDPPAHGIHRHRTPSTAQRNQTKGRRWDPDSTRRKPNPLVDFWNQVTAPASRPCPRLLHGRLDSLACPPSSTMTLI